MARKRRSKKWGRVKWGNGKREIHTVEECIKALQLYISGCRVCDIARELNIPYSTVISWIKGKKIPREVFISKSIKEPQIKIDDNIAKWAYLAGIIDADGYVGILKYIDKGCVSPHYKPKLDITGDWKLMLWLNDNIEESSIEVKHEPFVYQWRVFRKRSISKILEKTIPFMVTKKKRAIIVKELCDLPLNKHSKKIKESLYRKFRQIMNEWHRAFGHPIKESLLPP